MKLDVLAIVAHPDDAELGAGGTLCKLAKKGKKTGVVDLTRGELGTRGTPELRSEEAAAAGKILGLSARENLQLPDGLFEETPHALKTVVEVIRKYQPHTLLINAPSDRHPDHGRGAALVKRAAFLSNLLKFEAEGNPWKPKNVYHIIQDHYHTPDFVMDITMEYKVKMDSILAYQSQFYEEGQTGPQTAISGKDFLHFLESRAREMGRLIGKTYGEGFISTVPLLGKMALFEDS